MGDENRKRVNTLTGWLRQHERTIAFIDGPNFYTTAKQLNVDLDFSKLREYLMENSDLLRICYYTAVQEDQEYNPIRPLVDWLDYNGYSMIAKPTKEFTDSMGRRRIKGNMDIEIAIDMMEAAANQNVGHVILFSGDGDFRRLLESVKRQNVRVSVVSTINLSPGVLADELRREADHFVDVSDLRPYIEREPGARPERGDRRPRYSEPQQNEEGFNN